MKLTNSEEIDRFSAAVDAYFNLQIDADRFTAMRLQQGVYGQRQEGVNMIRVKVPGGSISPVQLEAIAEVLDNYSQTEEVHITTRQDIQIHSVPLQDSPASLRILEGAGLTTREACGNTIRNITACPMAGVCPKEHVDVTTHLEGAVLHFLRNPLNQQMPRKMKISFSGCEADCAQAMIHDV
ncbi:MAG: nitrite/sulfite reductase, partial [Burkholderiales bacterium]|nr:nitrite/sulfite reductase [Burkholderiales bacterium]